MGSSAPSSLIRRGRDPPRRAAWAAVPLSQDRVLRAELCSSVPGGVAEEAVRVIGVTREAVREQAGAGTR